LSSCFSPGFVFSSSRPPGTFWVTYTDLSPDLDPPDLLADAATWKSAGRLPPIAGRHHASDTAFGAVLRRSVINKSQPSWWFLFGDFTSPGKPGFTFLEAKDLTSPLFRSTTNQRTKRDGSARQTLLDFL
jgi:hypothetical protein